MSRQRGYSQPGWARVDVEEHCRSHLQIEERSHDLLRQWLSPDQAAQYDKYERFEVVGSDTRYRSLRGTMMNICTIGKRSWPDNTAGARGV